MQQALDDALCAEFPDIFSQRHGDMRNTAMCWGFECGDGWYTLIRHLCLRLTADVRREEADYAFYAAHAALPADERATAPQWIQDEAIDAQQTARLEKIAKLKAELPVAMQVKEKYGTLRFYVSGETEQQSAMIENAEAMSGIICEECGMTTGTKTYTTGWYRTLCPSCAETGGYLPETTDDESYSTEP